jgi:hypothetical protein
MSITETQRVTDACSKDRLNGCHDDASLHRAVSQLGYISNRLQTGTMTLNRLNMVVNMEDMPVDTESLPKLMF